MREPSRTEAAPEWVSEKREWHSLEDYLLFLRHKKAYDFAGTRSQRKNVLDYGCGGGYGSKVLSDYAERVVAVDIDVEALRYCADRYVAPNLSFHPISPESPLPFEDEVFDLVVSFQVIEHIPDVRRYLLELRRVLKETGELIITTPNRKHRLLPFQKPWNPHHLREYSAAGLVRELSPVFDIVEILGVYGTEEINEIERRRVRQSPLTVYLRWPVARVLKAVLPDAVTSRLKNWVSSETPRQKLTPNLLGRSSIEDFTVGSNLKRSIDLLATCQKA